jgi:hypothetical protein
MVIDKDMNRFNLDPNLAGAPSPIFSRIQAVILKVK